MDEYPGASPYYAVHALSDGRVGYVYPLLGRRARLGVSQADDHRTFDDEW